MSELGSDEAGARSILEQAGVPVLVGMSVEDPEAALQALHRQQAWEKADARVSARLVRVAAHGQTLRATTSRCSRHRPLPAACLCRLGRLRSPLVVAAPSLTSLNARHARSCPRPARRDVQVTRRRRLVLKPRSTRSRLRSVTFRQDHCRRTSARVLSRSHRLADGKERKKGRAQSRTCRSVRSARRRPAASRCLMHYSILPC